MRKIFLFPTLCLCIASGLAAPRILFAESGIVFDAAKGAMTGQLDMGNYALYSSSAITAARYQINGSTVLAILPTGDGTSLGIGLNAGRLNTGSYNVFAGNEAGYSNTTAMNNSFFGDRAGRSNTSDSNSIFGSRAGYYTTSGADNSFMGTYAGYANDTGTGNSFFGSRAAYYNVTGSYNSILGFYAGTQNLGSYNSFFGSRAGYYNTTGSNNTANGKDALLYNQTGAANSVFGGNAGGLGAGGVNSFSSSTIMGYQAGYNLTTGGDNTFLGWQAGYDVTTGTGNIVIGYDKRTSAPGANNELNIGGVLYGDLTAKTIGISTRVPQAALDILSTGTAAGQMAQLWRDGAGVVKGSMSATGVMMAAKFVGDGGVPSGAVMFFNLTSCPTGWTALTAAQGRYLVGLPSGGTLAGTVGTALTDLENRATGVHSHGITDPSHAHSYTIINDGVGSASPGGNLAGGAGSNTGSSATGITVNASAGVAGTNAPYLQLLVCEKN